MKALFYLILTLSLATKADKFRTILDEAFEERKCVDSLRLGYKVIQKIDSRHYELRGDGIAIRPYALLETKDSEIQSGLVPDLVEN